jgi:hypothetical protein
MLANGAYTRKKTADSKKPVDAQEKLLLERKRHARSGAKPGLSRRSR